GPSGPFSFSSIPARIHPSPDRGRAPPRAESALLLRLGTHWTRRPTMKRPSLAFLLLNALFLPGAAMAVESLNVPIITNPNGNDTADVISVAASEVTPDGARLLVWVDATTRRVYAQVIDARTNAPIDAPIIVGWPQMAFSHNLPALTNGTPGPLMQYRIVNSGMPGQPRVLFHPDAEQWFVVWPV